MFMKILASLIVVSIVSFRPFPSDALRAALGGAKRIVVMEKGFAVGFGGIVATNVRMALQGVDTHVHTVVCGLGGRSITQPSLHRMFEAAIAGTLEDLHFLDLNRDLVERELARQADSIASGPIAENLIRDIARGTGAANA